MSCILRVSGEHLDVDALLSSVDLRPDNLWHRGEPRFKSKLNGKTHAHSGANFVASHADFCEFQLQIEDAIIFLEDHAEKIAFILAFEGIEHASLDFGIELRDMGTHSDILPPRFLKAAGNSGVTVELSHYPCTKDEEPANTG